MLRNKWIAPMTILVMILFSAVVYTRLPEQVPMHWGIDGKPDRYGGRLEGTIFLPVFTLLIWLLLANIHRLDPKKENYPIFQGAFQAIINAIIVFMGVIHVAVLGTALGWEIAVVRIISVGMGLLFAVMGNVMGQVRPNHFVGIRTPWTLNDPEVWRQTHRVSARLFVGAGLLVALGGLLLDGLALVVVLLGLILGASLGSVIYSYIAWKRLRPAQPSA